MAQLLVATGNAKKLLELERILLECSVSGLQLLSVKDVPAYLEPVENGATFVDNALIKARVGAQESGLASLADDSGLAVDALNGMPGIFSARWAGVGSQVSGDQRDKANRDLLLAQMSDVPVGRRSARFHCACALVLPDGQEFITEGVWEGEILCEALGDKGFGYDPIFLPAQTSVSSIRTDILPAHTGTLNTGVGSAAQLDAVDKDALSHRGKALRAMVAHLKKL